MTARAVEGSRASQGRVLRLAPKAILLNQAVAAAYAITGALGLKLAFVAHAVTLFWPPSGIAFAVLWLGGYRLAPGVTLGAFLVNLWVLGSPGLAAVVAVGNTLPSVASLFALKRIDGARGGARELTTVLWFILIPVLAATLLSASVGTLTLRLAGRITDAKDLSTWVLWWLGDAMGVLIVAPPIILARRWISYPWRWASAAEAACFGLAGVAVIVALGVLQRPLWASELCKLLTLILCLGAGARFRLQGAAVMGFLMAIGATLATFLGAGPFVRGSFFDSFALLHSYLFAQGVTAFIIAAALDDLRRSVAQEQAARSKVEAAASDRVRLFNMISHDLRTPLNGIMGVLQTLRAADLPLREARLAALALRAGHTLTTLTSDILDVARADSGQILLREHAFSPAETLRDLIALHRPAALAKDLTLDLIGVETLPIWLCGDAARFAQLMGNLVTNAIAYTQAGGVRVVAIWRPEAARGLVIEVIDTGPGLGPQVAAGTFDVANINAPGKYAGRSAGLGLGLQICRRLVELMGGAITYRRTLTGGSLFRVQLALAACDPPSPPLAARDADVAGVEGWRILLVEDDLISQEVSVALLQASGFDVSVASDADSAVALASSRAFDVILMDQHLSGGVEGSGVDATRRIRALEGAAARTLIVGLTADARDDHHADYLAAGMDTVLVKPLVVDAVFHQRLMAARAVSLACRTATTGQD